MFADYRTFFPKCLYVTTIGSSELEVDFDRFLWKKISGLFSTDHRTLDVGLYCS